MLTKDALHDLFSGMTPDKDFSIDDWLADDWLRARIGGHLVRVFPKWGYKKALILHDTHHVVTGYGTDLPGELALASWELGSGGCGLSLFFWIDRIFALLLGLVFMPRRMLAAFRAGTRCRNLYGRDPQEVLAAELDDVRKFVEARNASGSASRSS